MPLGLVLGLSKTFLAVNCIKSSFAKTRLTLFGSFHRGVVSEIRISTTLPKVLSKFLRPTGAGLRRNAS